MNALLKLSMPLAAAVAIAACNAGGTSSLPASNGQSIAASESRGRALTVCRGSRIGQAQCGVLLMIGLDRDKPSGWTPADLESAYDLPSTTKGSGQIVAIVDAYDNPDVASDLAKYRSRFGLPAANFTKYNQDGQQGNYPKANQDWGAEIDLDTQMVSASCPNCTIDLVEANSNDNSDLQTAEAEAVTLGAHIVSNSYSGLGLSQSYYDTSGVTYLAAAGDWGYGVADPADFSSVVSVGGTMLSKGGGKRGWTEVVWNIPKDEYATGGGCSDQAKPSWQHDPGCTYRTANDVAAIAWNVLIYDSYGWYSYKGWFPIGGTSASTPFLAGVFGLAGNATSQNGGEAFWTMSKEQRSKNLFEITSGNDGICRVKYLCTAGTHEYQDYSGPAGWGTPNGIGAF